MILFFARWHGDRDPLEVAQAYASQSHSMMMASREALAGRRVEIEQDKSPVHFSADLEAVAVRLHNRWTKICRNFSTSQVGVHEACNHEVPSEDLVLSQGFVTVSRNVCLMCELESQTLNVLKANYAVAGARNIVFSLQVRAKRTICNRRSLRSRYIRHRPPPPGAGKRWENVAAGWYGRSALGKAAADR